MDMHAVLKKSFPYLATAMLVASAALALSTAPEMPLPTPLAAVNAARVATLTNDEREQEGLSALARNPLLDRAAQMKAEDMAAKGYYAHVSPEGITPMYWVEKAGYKYLIIGENLVVNRADAKQVVEAFMGSPGHKANILRKDFTEIGVGVATGTYKGKDATFTVQIFAAPYPRQAAAKPLVSKENVKPISNIPEVATAPKTPVASVPRAPVARAAAEARPSTTAEVIQTTPLAEKVKELIKPISNPLHATSAPALATSTAPAFPLPSTLLDAASPVELPAVSPSLSGEPPLPVGSTWSMQFRLFIDGMIQRTRGFFGD